jgi:cytochrome b561
MSSDIIIDNVGNENHRAERFDRISMLLHWLTVLLVVIQLATVWFKGLGGAAPLG